MLNHPRRRPNPIDPSASKFPPIGPASHALSELAAPDTAVLETYLSRYSALFERYERERLHVERADAPADERAARRPAVGELLVEQAHDVVRRRGIGEVQLQRAGRRVRRGGVQRECRARRVPLADELQRAWQRAPRRARLGGRGVERRVCADAHKRKVVLARRGAAHGELGGGRVRKRQHGRVHVQRVAEQFDAHVRVGRVERHGDARRRHADDEALGERRRIEHDAPRRVRGRLCERVRLDRQERLVHRTVRPHVAHVVRTHRAHKLLERHVRVEARREARRGRRRGRVQRVVERDEGARELEREGARDVARQLRVVALHPVRRKRTQQRLDVARARGEAQVDDQHAQRRLERHAGKRVLRDVRVEHRAVLLLHHVQDLPVAQVALVLGIAAGIGEDDG